MRTDALVEMLASGIEARDMRAVRARNFAAVVAGTGAAALLMAALLGVRHDIASAAGQPMFWFKTLYVVTIAFASLAALSRLARPGVPFTAATLALVIPVALMWLLGSIELGSAVDASQRRELLFGRTWTSCPWLIAALSVPPFVALAWAVRRLAPVRLRLCGAVLGLAAGATASVVYSLHCPEMGAPFLGSWYLLGMLLPAAVGAAIGPRLLRW